MEEYSHNVGTFIGKGGVEIFFQSWGVKKPKGVVVIAHGLGEHSGRYSNVIEKLKGKGISFYALDHRGHGRSGGKRGHIMSFMEYVYDLKLLIDFVKVDSERLPLILLGHSMGGTIAIKFALAYHEDINGIIISSAGLVTALEVPRWKESLGKFFSRRMPGLTMPSGLPPEYISRDAAVVEAYKGDPLVHDKVSTRWFTEFTSAGQECLSRASELKMPILLFHGTDDKLVDYRGTERVYEAVSSKDRTLYLFDGLYHETMNEIPEDRNRVLDIVSKWILKRVAKKKAASRAKPSRAPKTAAGAKTGKAKKKAAAKKASSGKEKKTSSPKKSPAKKSTAKKSTKKR
jgi:acylglycerol lipase